MTDRELLERAAKAAGIVGEWTNPMPHAVGNGTVRTGIGGRLWNHLTDDGDALRLAVALNLSVMNIKDGEHAFTNVVGSGPKPGNFHDVYEDHNGDSTAATRRAITRAAAAMGGE